MHKDLAALVREHAEYAYTLGPTFCIRGSVVHSPPPRVCRRARRGGGREAPLGEASPTLSFPTYIACRLQGAHEVLNPARTSTSGPQDLGMMPRPST